ncbi:MAG: tetratricopeptide repeat protein [Mucilaginibacter sp.]
MKPFLIIILTIFSLAAFAQDKVADNLKTLIDSNQYNKVIEHAVNSNGYSAKSLYYIGMAYYMKEDDSNSIKFMERSINKDSKYAKAYYIKAETLNYMSKYEEAINTFKQAIALEPDNGEYYSGLGDSFYNQKKNELALAAYKTATYKKDAPGRAYSMIAQIFSQQKDDENALAAFYIAKSKVSKASDSYQNALYNIGLYESLKGDYDKAEPAFIELIDLSPNDYQSYAKLIQLYHHNKEYGKARPYIEKLYDAHAKGQLKDNLKDMFCFEQFKWNDKLIQAFERFESGAKNDIYRKHIFYIKNSDEVIEYTIQTEYSPILVEQTGEMYLLCMSKGDRHYTFNAGFKGPDIQYDVLKKSVIDVLDQKVKPLASSIKSQ